MYKKTKLLAFVLAGCMAFSTLPAGAAQAAIEQSVEEGTKITGLTTNYQTSPLGIETEGIRFGWRMESDQIGTKQTAYQIKVYGEDESEIWDSGKVESGRSAGIACKGALALASRYRWEATVWDEKGKAHSAQAFFETGVTGLEDWEDAEFIRMNKSRLAPVFRCEKPLEQANVKKARLYITALGAYQAYVNGIQAGEWDEEGNLVTHHMNPGYGNGNDSLGYQSYDVTQSLSGSDSVAVSVQAGTGWYHGMGNTDVSQPAVKALLKIDYEDGTKQIIQTNTADWKGTLAGGITANGVYYGEDYNAIFARELGDYTKTGYDDSAWVNAAEGGEQYSGVPRISNKFSAQTASYVRLLVHESGPAIQSSRENLLQIMELELLDEQKNNVVRGILPEVSNSWSPNELWSPAHLTDGDLGLDSGKGYTSQMMGTAGLASYEFADPVSITINLGKAVSFDTLNLYPRTTERSVSGNECANYPKRYTLQISQNGTDWTDVDLNGEAQGVSYTVDSLRNTELFPEVSAFHYDTEFGENVTAKQVKISISKVGPAVYEVKDSEKENRLQIMELELWNGVENVAAGIVPTVSQSFAAGTQWRPENLTDGDFGTESDSGYTTDILDRQKTEISLDEPITIQFQFDQAVEFSSLRIFPRSNKDSILSGIYANYPKAFTVSVSEDGEHWRELGAEEEKGLIRKAEPLLNMRMSTTEFPGEIRAQTGLPGRMTGAYDQYPVNAYSYNGMKEESEFLAGEVDIKSEYEGAEMFDQGIELKKGDTMVVNMGQNLTAVPNIRFSAPQGTMATLRFAEMLNDGSKAGNGAFEADGPKGSIYQKSLRNARSKATYVFAGDGVETYQPCMSFFGYQYVEITASDDIVIYGLISKGISSVSDQTGEITTNNENVNKLFRNVLFGQLSNYYTAPTDCNQRDERLSWTGDTQAFAQTAVYNFDSYAFLSDMQEIFDEVTARTGYVPSVTDQSGSFFGNWAAGWSDVMIIVPWTLYLQTGDLSFLEDHWQYMDSYMTYLRDREQNPREGGRGLNRSIIPDNARNYGDWLSFQGTCVEVIYDYYYGYMNQLMAQIAGILGKEDKKAAYEEKFQGIKETFLATHVTFEDNNLVIKSGEGQTKYQFMHSAGKGGVWENNSQTSLIWMLKLGFYENEEMRDAARELLITNIKNKNPDPASIRAQAKENTLAVGFLGSNVITPLLTDIGDAQVSYDLLLQDSQPSWLFEVKAGATTVWERWNSYTPGVGFGDSEMNSFNHYAYGSVVEWMYRYMAGIAADEENPGFKNIILQPTLDTGTKYNEEERIDSVDASYESMYGRIDSSWKSQDGKLSSYHTQIPANTTATLYLPVDAVDADQLPDVSGVVFAGMTEHHGQQKAKFILESGGYDFTVSDGKVTPAHSKEYGGESGDKPGTDPGDQPGTNPDPGNKPGTNPDTGNKPGTNPDTGNKPGTDSGNTEKTLLSACQIGTVSRQYYNGKAIIPSITVQQNGKPLVKGRDYTVQCQNNIKIGTAKMILTGIGSYTGTAEKTFEIAVKKNASYTVGNYKYKIVNARTDGKGTVKITGVKSSSVRKKLKKITVAAKVNIGGKNFTVTAIEKNAFKNCAKASSAQIKANVTSIGSKAFYGCKKLKKITIQSKKLKTVGKNAFQKINAKASIEVPKAKLKAYKKKLKGKGQKKTVKIIALKK